jgi:cytidine deaminase
MNLNVISGDAKFAMNARNRSYAPYTGFTVGAVLMCKNGKRYIGCNIENGGIQSYCAERVAFLKAISEGEKEFEYIVIAGGEEKKPVEKECLPCGYCRQFMSEFVQKDFKIYTVGKDKLREYLMEDLLPHSFEL